MTAAPLAAPLRGRDRKRIRSLKRLARAGSSPVAQPALQAQSQLIVLELLERSIRFGHRRLALQRLRHAADLGAPLRDDHWRYCQQVAQASNDKDLVALFAMARRLAS